MWKENNLKLVFHVCGALWSLLKDTFTEELTPLLMAGHLKSIVGSGWALRRV